MMMVSCAFGLGGLIDYFVDHYYCGFDVAFGLYGLCCCGCTLRFAGCL